jgi:hypothetical protein
MAKAEALPFQVELHQADYLELLKQAKRQSRVSARLIAAVEHERKRDAYLFSGYVTDGLALRGVALVHAPKALAAIDRALKRARSPYAQSVPHFCICRTLRISLKGSGARPDGARIWVIRRKHDDSASD